MSFRVSSLAKLFHKLLDPSMQSVAPALTIIGSIFIIISQISSAVPLISIGNNRLTDSCLNRIQIVSFFGRDVADSFTRPTLPQRDAKIKGASIGIGWLPGPSKFIGKKEKLTKILYEASVNKHDSIEMWLVDEFSRGSYELNKYGAYIVGELAKQYPQKKFLVAMNYVDPQVVDVLRNKPNVYFAPLLMIMKSTFHADKRASISPGKARLRLTQLRHHITDKQIVPVVGMFFPHEQIFEKNRLNTFESDMNYILDGWMRNGEYLAIYNNQNKRMLAALRSTICESR